MTCGDVHVLSLTGCTPAATAWKASEGTTGASEGAGEGVCPEGEGWGQEQAGGGEETAGGTLEGDHSPIICIHTVQMCWGVEKRWPINAPSMLWKFCGRLPASHKSCRSFVVHIYGMYLYGVCCKPLMVKIRIVGIAIGLKLSTSPSLEPSA